jgi:hypothetical protein
MLGWLRDHFWKAVILAGLGASVTAYFEGVFDAIISDTLPTGAEISCRGREWVADRWPSRQPEAPPDRFRILIAKLAGDDASGSLTQAVVRAFQGQQSYGFRLINSG